MNSSRDDFNPSLMPKRLLTANRVLGFLECDGSLPRASARKRAQARASAGCLPNMLPAILFKQHAKNKHFLEEIADFCLKFTLST